MGSFPIETCVRCHVERRNPERPFFPLWFTGQSGEALCPNCVSGRAVTPQLVVVETRAVAMESTGYGEG